MNRHIGKGAGRLALFFSCLFMFYSHASKVSHSKFFTVSTDSIADEARLPEVFRILEKARRGLRGWGFVPPTLVRIVIHPTLADFRETGAQWFELARANPGKNKIDTQRTSILDTHGSLEITLRHEFFHLVQPMDWPRWRSEGCAVLFSGAYIRATSFENTSEAELNRHLEHPNSQIQLNQSMATAAIWAKKTGCRAQL
ncbi:MAG: hypothetical protein U0Z75_03495 [Deinococcaceae bacterium]